MHSLLLGKTLERYFGQFYITNAAKTRTYSPCRTNRSCVDTTIDSINPTVLDFCGAPTLDERFPRLRRTGIAGTSRRKRRRRTKWRRRGWRGVQSSDPRAPDVGILLPRFFLFVFLLVLFSCVISFDRLRCFPWARSLVCFSFLLLCVTFLVEGGTRVPPLSPPFGAGRQTGKG